MKKYLSIASIFLFCILIFWFFIKPRFDTKKASLAGEVVSITKMKRSGDYIIELKENNKSRFINYTFVNDNFDVQVGDSLFKKTDSDLFVKSKVDGVTKLANDQTVLISE